MGGGSQSGGRLRNCANVIEHCRLRRFNLIRAQQWEIAFQDAAPWRVQSGAVPGSQRQEFLPPAHLAG